MAKSLTQKALEAMKPGAARKEIPDGGLPGLYFVIQPSGATSWAVRYRHNGKPKKFTIGPYPRFGLADARNQGRAALRAASEGRDPAGDKKAEREAARWARPVEADLVETVFGEFIIRHVKAKNRTTTANEAARMIDREIIPVWGKRRIQDITRRDVVDLLDKIVDRGAPYQANRVHALLRKAFNWFLQRDILHATPVANIGSPASEEARDRVLTDDEVKLLWEAAEAAGWPFGPLAKLLLLTGQRRDEVAAAEWSEFDLDAKEPTWTIPKERAKNNQVHRVDLAPVAVEILKGQPRVKDKDGQERLVFTTTGNTPISGFSRGKANLDAEMLMAAKKLAQERGDDHEKVKIAPWRFHDLRRTAASGMAALGVTPHVVEKILNHRSGTIRGVAAIYNRHDYAGERRRALSMWGEYVVSRARTSDHEPQNVIRLGVTR